MGSDRINTRIVDTIIVFVAITGIILVVAVPPLGWLFAGFILAALAFGGDA